MKITYSQNYQYDRVYRTDLNQEDIEALDRRFRERAINSALFPHFTEGTIVLALAEEKGEDLSPEAEAYYKELCESFEDDDIDSMHVKVEGRTYEPYFTEFVLTLLKEYLDEYVVPSEYEDMVDESFSIR